MAAPAPVATTQDAFYNGRLVLTQPARGHRSGTDAVLLASAVPASFAGRCYDVGSGVGVVGLGVALLHPGANVVLVERDETMVDMARENAVSTRGVTTVEVVACDVLDHAERHRELPRRADLVLTNPPFRDPSRHRSSPDPLRRVAHTLAESADLRGWIEACLDCLANKGTFILIHTAAALPCALAAMSGNAGAIVVKPVLPRAGQTAHRVLVRAVKGSRAPFTLAPPLILHDDKGRFTDEAAFLHRGEATLVW